MATIYQVTNNYDYGDGSLRNALEQCVDGDKIIFNEVAFPCGSTTYISFEDAITIDSEVAVDAIVDGDSSGVARVAFDGSNRTKLFNIDDTVTFKGIKFLNGKSEQNEGVVNILNNKTVRFEKCAFKNNVGSCVSYSSNARINKVELIDCSFENNEEGTCVFKTKDVLFKRCSFKGNSRIGNGSSIYVTEYESVKIEETNFENEEEPIFLRKQSGTSQVSILSCSVNGNVDCDENDIILNGVRIEGVLNCSASNASFTIRNSNYVKSVCVNYACFTFDESQLSSIALTSAPTSGEFHGTGYVATTSSVCLNNYDKDNRTVVCSYGCNISSVSSQVTDVLGTIRWQGESLSIPILIEKKIGSKWEIQTKEATDGCWEHGTIQEGRSYAFRLFDGLKWKELALSRESGVEEISEVFTNNNEDGSGTLRKALEDAKEGSVVTPDSDIWDDGEGVVLELQEPLLIDKNVSLAGSSKNRIVLIPKGENEAVLKIDYDCDTTILENIDFIGRVESYGKSITFKNCRFFNCQGGQGAFTNYRSDNVATVSFQNCVVANNRNCGIFAGVSGCVLSFVNSTIIGNETCDVKANGSKSITRFYNSIIGATILNASVVNRASAINVLASSCGFVDFNATSNWSTFDPEEEWENWDFSLNPDSPYVSLGDSSFMTSRDFNGVVRGSYSNAPEPRVSCSLGAFERIVADLFWIGKDGEGNAVSNASFNSVNGWASSIDSETCGEIAPSASSSLYIASNATFTDGFKGKSIVVAESVSCVLNGSNESFVDASVVLKDDSILTIGASEKINIKTFYSGKNAKLIANGDFTFKDAVINSELNIASGSTLRFEDSTLSLESYVVPENATLILTRCNVNIDELEIKGNLLLNGCTVLGTDWKIKDSGKLQSLEDSFSVNCVKGTNLSNALFSNSSLSGSELDVPNAEITFENKTTVVSKINAKNISVNGGTLKADSLIASDNLTVINASVQGSDWNVGSIETSGETANIGKLTVVQSGTVKFNNAKGTEWKGTFILYVGSNERFEVENVECLYFVVEGGTLTSNVVKASQNCSSNNGTLNGTQWTINGNLTSTNSVLTATNVTINGLAKLVGGSLTASTFKASSFDANDSNIDCDEFVHCSPCSIVSTSNKTIKLDALRNASLNLSGSTEQRGTLEIERVDDCDITATNYVLKGEEWTFALKSLNIENCSLEVNSVVAQKQTSGTFSNVVFDCNKITFPSVDIVVVQNELSCSELNVKNITSNSKTVDVATLNAETVTSENSTLRGTSWEINGDFNSTNDAINVANISVASGKNALLYNPQIDFNSTRISGSIDLTLNQRDLECESASLKNLKASNCTVEVVNLAVQNSVVLNKCAFKINELAAASLSFDSSNLQGINWTVGTLKDFNENVSLTENELKSTCDVTNLVVESIQGKKNSVLNGSSLIIEQTGTFDFVDCRYLKITVPFSSSVKFSKDCSVKKLEVYGKLNVNCNNFNAETLNFKENSESVISVEAKFEASVVNQEENALLTLFAQKYKGTNWNITSALVFSGFESFEVDNATFGQGTNFNATNATVAGSSWIFGTDSVVKIEQDAIDFDSFTCKENSSLDIKSKRCSIDSLVSNGTATICVNDEELIGTRWTLNQGKVSVSDAICKLDAILFNGSGTLNVENSKSGFVNSAIVGNNGKIDIANSTLTLGNLKCGQNGTISVSSEESVEISNVDAGLNSNVLLDCGEKIKVQNLNLTQAKNVSLESKIFEGTTWKLGNGAVVKANKKAIFNSLELLDNSKFEISGDSYLSESTAIGTNAKFTGQNCSLNSTTLNCLGTAQLTNVAAIGATWNFEGDNPSCQLNNSSVDVDTVVFKEESETSLELTNRSNVICQNAAFLGLVQCSVNDGSFVTVKNSLTRSENCQCSFISSKNGYFAVKPNTNVDFIDFNNVVACDYGANVSSIKTNAGKISWTRAMANNEEAGVLLERQNSSGRWEIVQNKIKESYYVDSQNEECSYRLFDGEKFKYDSFWSLNATLWQVVSTAITTESSCYRSDPWQKGSDNEICAKVGQDVSILARVYNAFGNKNLYNDGENIRSVKYSCVRYKTGLFDSTEYPVQGHVDVEVGTNCVLDEIHTSSAWNKDSIGFNVVVSPNATTYPIFPVQGFYRIGVTITLKTGNPIVFYAFVNVR